MDRIDTLFSRQGISVENQFMENLSVGVGRIIVPSSCDREEFVKTCFRTGRVDLYDETNGQYLRQCVVTAEVLQNIRFPREGGAVGEAVVWVSQPQLFPVPMVVGTFSGAGSVNLRQDEELIIHKEWDAGSVDIQAGAKTGTLYISVSGQLFSHIRVAALGNEKSLLELNSSGTVALSGNRQLKLRAYNTVDLQLINPENGLATAVKSTLEGTEIRAEYEVNGENDTHTTHTINLDKDKIGIKSAINGDDVQYENTITEDECLTTYKDTSISLKKGCAAITQGDSSLMIKGGKVTFENNSTGLRELLDKLVSTIETLTVATSMGPSGTPLPPTMQALAELKQMLADFFEE